MKKLVLSFIIGSLSISHAVAQKGYPIDPVPFTSVKVSPGTFWGQRLEASRKVTIPLAFSKCEETGRYTNFSNAAQHLKDPSKVFKVEGLAFDDTDPYKTLEGAVAYYQATGKRKFLDIACRYADCAIREVEPNPGQMCVVPGHQIAEMAMARLYLVTGEKKYIDFAKYLLDYRGKTTIKHEYSQAHKPVIEQDEAVGHAVRAAYMG